MKASRKSPQLSEMERKALIEMVAKQLEGKLLFKEQVERGKAYIKRLTVPAIKKSS